MPFFLPFLVPLFRKKSRSAASSNLTHIRLLFPALDAENRVEILRLQHSHGTFFAFAPSPLPLSFSPSRTSFYALRAVFSPRCVEEGFEMKNFFFFPRLRTKLRSGPRSASGRNSPPFTFLQEGEAVHIPHFVKNGRTRQHTFSVSGAAAFSPFA